MRKTIDCLGCVIICLALFLAVNIPTFAGEIDENFVGIWLFDEGDGEDVADLTDNSNDGEINGSGNWVDGKFGSAIDFDGATTVIVPNDETLMPSEQMTVTAWVTFHDAGIGQDTVIARIEPGFSLQKFNTDIMEGWVNIGGWKGIREVAGGTILEPDEWYHVAFTYDGDTLISYIDGEPDREAVIGGNIDVAEAPFTIGSYKGEAYHWQGMIDEVSISNIARTEEEIKGMMLGFEDFLAVSPNGKLAASWGKIKNGR